MDAVFGFIKNSVTIGGLIFIAFAVYLYFNQNSMIYIPVIDGVCNRDIHLNPVSYRSPEEYRLMHEVLKIKTSDNINLYGWLIYTSSDSLKKKPTIIYFQENAGNIGMRLPLISAIIQSVNVNVIIVGYRGYGPSEGSPSESGIKLDSEAVLNYVFSEMKTKINIKQVFIMGRSIGGAVATYVQAKLSFPIKGLILENTFLSVGDLVDKLFPLMSYIKGFLLTNNWETKKIISKITVPTFFIMSDRDELVPYAHMLELIRLATPNAKFIRQFLIKGGGHNDGFTKDPTNYLSNYKKFVDEAISESEDKEVSDKKQN